MKRLLKLIAAIGPGIFAIGYTIGTGSVTSMAKAGADYGLGLLWVLFLSCVFSGVLMTAYGRFAAVTGETSLHGMIRFLPGGKLLAWLVFLGIVMGQYTCLGGIMILTAGAIKEAFGVGFGVFPIAVVIMAVMYSLLMIGKYSFFEKVLTFFVMLMALTFLVSIFVTWPDAQTLARAVKPLIPNDNASLLIFAAFVGTTLAAPTFVTRPLLIKEKGLTIDNLRQERIDAVISATMMFVISGAIIMVATGALFAYGKGVDRILDMAGTLKPLAGRFAVAIFMVGTLSAGLSSVFPIMMVGPLLLGDAREGKMDTKSKTFRIICLIAALWGLVVPALGSNPVSVTIAAQIANVFVLPLVVFAIIWLMNRKPVMGVYRAGWVMNLLLASTLVFSIVVSTAGVIALIKFFEKPKPVLVVNEDNDHFFKFGSEWMTREGLLKYLDGILQGKVTDFVMCVCGQRASYDSKTWEPIWIGMNEPARQDTAMAKDGTHDRWAVNAKMLHDAGIDPYEVWIGRCRERGVRPWVSMRMNDIHFAPITNFFRTATFCRNRKYWREPKSPQTWFDYALDYAHPEVREYNLRQVEEIATRWNVDGVELDWMRSPLQLRKGHEREDAHFLTEFMREARRITEMAGKIHGHRVLLAVRVPRSPELAEQFGYEVGKWMEEGLVDRVVASSVFFADPELPVAEWKEYVSIHNPKVELLPSIDCFNLRDASYFRGMASKYHAGGADGLYLFNAIYVGRYDSDGRKHDEDTFGIICREGLSGKEIENLPQNLPPPKVDFPF